jgi:uncharacterized protein YndB with AHSA1/START domain
MFIRIVLAVLAVAAVLAVVVATRPAGFRVERRITIAAPAPAVFALIDDLHAWSRWSPYETGDAALQKTYEGPAAGVGAAFHYVSPKNGEGRMTITAAEPDRRVALRADFLEPFALTHDVEFTLAPAADGVAVTWAMTGENGFVFKAFGLVFDVDKLLGEEFERGLDDLKREAEAGGHTS